MNNNKSLDDTTAVATLGQVSQPGVGPADQQARASDAKFLETPRILVLDDTRVTQHIVQQILNDNGYDQVRITTTPAEANKCIDRFMPHIIILDWLMDDVDGLALTRMIRRQDQLKNINTYIVMVTGKEGSAAMSTAFTQGVDDYIAKKDVQTQLVPRLLRARHWLAHQAHVNAKLLWLESQLQQHKRLITVDPTTRLPSGQAFGQYLQASVEASLARELSISCVYLSFENYPALKEKLSQAGLQQVMQMFSDKLRRQLRPTDFLARVSSHEFCAVIHHPNKHSVESADRFEKAFHQFSLKTSQGFHTISVRAAMASVNLEQTISDCDHRELIKLLRQAISQDLPLVNRVRLVWPLAKHAGRAVEDFMFES